MDKIWNSENIGKQKNVAQTDPFWSLKSGRVKEGSGEGSRGSSVESPKLKQIEKFLKHAESQRRKSHFRGLKF